METEKCKHCKRESYIFEDGMCENCGEYQLNKQEEKQ